jgi:hypothetical protein
MGMAQAIVKTVAFVRGEMNGVNTPCTKKQPPLLEAVAFSGFD